MSEVPPYPSLSLALRQSMWAEQFGGAGLQRRRCRIPLLLKLTGSTYALRRSTLDFCLGGLNGRREAKRFTPHTPHVDSRIV